MTTRYPGGTATFSKGPSQFPANAPRGLIRGEGAHVFTESDTDYLDYTMGLAAISLGYNDPDVTAAVVERAIAGTVFGTPTQLEYDYADAIGEVLPWSDYGIRYGKNGSDATEGAIRAARFITGRDNIISLGYHGWLTTCPNKNGIPLAQRLLVEETWDEAKVGAACLIVEADAIPDGELVRMRDWCDRTGTLLVFDEILTGFRTPTYWYSTYKAITPDLITAGKAIANGYPLSFVAGRAELMKVFGGDVGFSFTYAGETMGLAAGLATLKKYQHEPVIDSLWMRGAYLRGAWDKLETGIPLLGQHSRLVFKYPSLAMRTLASQEFIKRGILVTVGLTPCYALTSEDLSRTVEVMGEVAAVVKDAGDDPARLVDGPIVANPYRQMIAVGTST